MKNFTSLSLITVFYFLVFLILSVQERTAFGSLRASQEAKFQFKTRAALVLVSFEEYKENFDVASIPDRKIRWNWPREEEVRFRAMEVRPNLEFMQIKKKDDILARETRNIGVVGWVSHKIGDETHEVYVSSSIWDGKEEPEYDCYKIVLMPNRELAEVFYVFAPVNEEDGNITDFKEDKLQGGYYPVGRPIDLVLLKSELGESGFYYLEVGANLRGGGSTTLEIWFYHTAEN